MAVDRTGPKVTPQKGSRTCVDRTTPSLRRVFKTSNSPPSGGLWSPGIVNKWQSTSPNFCKYDELGAAVDRSLSGNQITTPVIIQVFRDKLYDSSIRDIYARCGMHLKIDPINHVTPQFVTHGLSTIDTPNKYAGVWIPGTRFRMPQDDAH